MRPLLRPAVLLPGPRRLSFVACLLVGVVAGVLPAGAQPARDGIAEVRVVQGGAPSVDADGDGLPDLEQLDPVVLDCEDADPDEPGVQGIEDCDEVIVEHAIVSTRTGARIWVDLIRPAIDAPVPTIMMASPYFNTLGRGWRGELKAPHGTPANPFRPATTALGGGETEVAFPEWYDEYFVPRGYAYAAMDLRGTRNSSGCQVYGDRDEVLDAVDVVDWIADQEWSNGRVGMTGGSYDGTIAIGAAAEATQSARHPEALAAIIPIRAISRWYDYHFFNGVQSSSHRLTPALFSQALAPIDVPNSLPDDVLAPLVLAEREACAGTIGAINTAGYASPYQDARAAFWRERDFLRTARTMNAAVFMIQGLLDYNVKSHNIGYLWEALEGTNVPRRLWWANMDHADPHIPRAQDAGSHFMPFPFQAEYIEANHRWWGRYLKGLDTGVELEPEVMVQRGDGAWDPSDGYPAVGTVDRVLTVSGDGTLVEDGATASRGALRYGDSPTAGGIIRLQTATFQEPTRLSGQIGFDLDMTASGPDATVAVEVKMLPADAPATTAGRILFNSATQPAPLTISYGWLRAYYRDSVPMRGLSTPTNGSFLEPGQAFDAQFGSLHTDIVVPAGYKLVFEISASDGGSVASSMSNAVEVLAGPGASRIHLPVVEG
jgi:X-Pro dipeptidyl-peptidase